MEKYKYPVRETINGITFIFTGPDLDPLTEGEKHSKDREGWIADYFLWKDPEDTPETHKVQVPLNTSGHVVRLYTAKTANDWWEYEIHTGGPNKQKFFRAHNGGAWSGPFPVTDLRVKLPDEADTGAVEQIKKSGDEQIRIQHPGTTCSVVWNPATRRYVRKCQ